MDRQHGDHISLPLFVVIPYFSAILRIEYFIKFQSQQYLYNPKIIIQFLHYDTIRSPSTKRSLHRTRDYKCK
jgi:hypothetical protein